MESNDLVPALIDKTNDKPKPKRRIIRRKNNNPKQHQSSEPPQELIKAITESSLPSNYNFEIHKTILRIQNCNATHVALQFPEGLLMYSCVLCDLIKKFLLPKIIQISILGDV